MSDEYMLDEEDEFATSSESSPDEQDYDDSDENESNLADSDLPDGMTQEDLALIQAYDDILLAGKQQGDQALMDAAYIIVMSNPTHTSATTIGNVIRDMFQRQGKARMVNTVYNATSMLKGEDVDADFFGDETGFNRAYSKEAKDQITRFIGYLADRDLSKDSVLSKRKKLNQIPAFIIFLFASGMYDLILDCPTMPKIYADQITNAMNKIMKMKLDIVEALAERYEQAGRPKVAERVRSLGVAWFNKEPAAIRSSSQYLDLDLTQNDVMIYREFRGKFTNISRAITQDTISDLIEVAVDPEAGVYKKLKDKTRADAIADVKQVYRNWSKSNPIDSELAKRVIWKDPELINKKK